MQLSERDKRKRGEVNWGRWKNELRRILRHVGYDSPVITAMDWAAWREYYDEGYSPSAAVNDHEE